MSGCLKCGSARVVAVCGKTDDRLSLSLGGKTYDGYVPSGMGIGGGDYLRFRYCLDCGQIQHVFPMAECAIEGSTETRPAWDR